MTIKRSLILDANNLLYRTFFAHIKESEDILIGMCHHSALWTLQKYYREYPADEVVVVFDSFSWRKSYTKDLTNCVTYKKYKGTRRQNLTASEQEKFDRFDEHVDQFAELLQNETALLVLKKKYLEADDLIAAYIQQNPDMNHVLVSSDKDFMQLMDKNVAIIDPDSGKPRSLKDWDNDPAYFMFEKCFRGDRTDNVISAYPNLRATKIKQAYTDEYMMQTLMNHTFTALVNEDDGSISERTLVTGEVFEENKLLMDLKAQPEYIKKKMATAIEEARERRGKFNYIKFMRFCSDNELKNILQNIDQFVPMLAGKKR